jgi:hypothetical protein
LESTEFYRFQQALESGSGPGGRRFKSSLPDQLFQVHKQDFWFFVYIAVVDFVDGQSHRVRYGGDPTSRQEGTVLRHNFEQWLNRKKTNCGARLLEISPDPAGSGWNQYAYATNPNSFVDPTGLVICAPGATNGEDPWCGMNGGAGGGPGAGDDGDGGGPGGFAGLGIGQLSGFASDNPFEIPDFPSGGSISIPCDFGICGPGFGPLGFEEGQGDSVTDDSSVTVAGNGVCYYVLVNPCGANNGTPQTPKNPCPIGSGKQFSGGISVSGATVNPLTSGGGSVGGGNFQTFDNETNNYTYTYSGSGLGMDVGASVQAVGAWGSGGWGGPFNSINISIGVYSGSIFWSPGKGGWIGASFGYGLGLPGVAYEKTNYRCR